jgi:hypothetical protein
MDGKRADCKSDVAPSAKASGIGPPRIAAAGSGGGHWGSDLTLPTEANASVRVLLHRAANGHAAHAEMLGDRRHAVHPRSGGLGERAKASYPAAVFVDQVLAIIGDGTDNLKGWHGTFVPARIAKLVQHFAHRDAPMTLALAQKFLRILDMLVDMGNRRSAVLQLGEAFREIPLSSLR